MGSLSKLSNDDDFFSDSPIGPILDASTVDKSGSPGGMHVASAANNPSGNTDAVLVRDPEDEEGPWAAAQVGTMGVGINPAGMHDMGAGYWVMGAM